MISLHSSITWPSPSIIVWPLNAMAGPPDWSLILGHQQGRLLSSRLSGRSLACAAINKHRLVAFAYRKLLDRCSDRQSGFAAARAIVITENLAGDLVQVGGCAAERDGLTVGDDELGGRFGEIHRAGTVNGKITDARN